MGKKRKQKKKQKVNRHYKSRLFEMVYRDKKELLDLYNAVNGTDYDNPEELEINTLENAIYLSMHNDVSFVIDSRLSLYEHQSTYSPNLPLRYLLYVSDLYSKMTKDANLYGSKRIPIPPPKFLIFYNGREERPEKEEMRLSDAFAIDDPAPSLELKAIMLNINPGYNDTLLKACKSLKDYVEYTSRVRQYAEEMSIEEAVERAITECISEDILAEFLMTFRAEAKKMSIYEYDEERQRRFDREEGWEDAVVDVIKELMKDDIPVTAISKYCKKPESEIREIIDALNGNAPRMNILNSVRYDTKKMSIYEYDEERQRRFDREEGHEEGREEMQIEMIKKMLKQNISISVIAECSGKSEAEINELINQLNEE